MYGERKEIADLNDNKTEEMVSFIYYKLKFIYVINQFLSLNKWVYGLLLIKSCWDYSNAL